jgi:hypothetical protein
VLLQAAEELGLTSLSKYCAAKAGSRAAALARYTPAQVGGWAGVAQTMIVRILL